MRLVVDTNVLITYFWPKSVFREVINKQNRELFAPQYALKEIEKHRKDIEKKTKNKEFEKIKKEIKEKVTFIPLEVYAKKLSFANKHSPDPNDIDFLALALLLEVPLWSNDKELLEQTIIPIVSTREVIELLLEG